MNDKDRVQYHDLLLSTSNTRKLRRLSSHLSDIQDFFYDTPNEPYKPLLPTIPMLSHHRDKGRIQQQYLLICNCLIIKKKLAEEYGLDLPSSVVLERRGEGILIRKLEI
jgi:hypothetical protein